MKDPEAMRAALKRLVAQKRAYHEAVLHALADVVTGKADKMPSTTRMALRGLRNAVRRHGGEV